jgi:ABC-type antimicrobial peptide transport system permease subunit
MSTINVNVVQSTGGTVTINDNLIVTGTNNIRPYKVYTAFLSQNGPPSWDIQSEVLHNTLGATITWSRVGVGDYRATASAPVFTAFKTIVFMQLSGLAGVTYPTAFAISRFSDTQITLGTVNTDSQSTRVDGRLGLTPVEIRVYY